MTNQVCVPTKALSLAGETGDTVAPEKGDRVTVTIEGTVDRVEGDLAYLIGDTANGEPMSAMQPADQMQGGVAPDLEGADLRSAWGQKEKMLT